MALAGSNRMKPVQINFAENNHLWHWEWRHRGVQIFLVLVALGLCTTVLIWHGWQRLQADMLVLDAKRLQSQHRQEQLDGQAPQSRQLGSEETRLLRQSEYLRNLPWEAIFLAFETLPSAGLDVFEPELTRGVIRVQAHTANLDSMQAYLHDLEKKPTFSRVNLLRHETQEKRLNFHFEVILAGPYRMPDLQVREAP